MNIVCYDIIDDKTRARVMNILSSNGIRIQYSFFRCDLPQNKFDKMIESILKLINHDEDRLYIYPVCGKCLAKPIRQGSGNIEKPETFRII